MLQILHNKTLETSMLWKKIEALQHLLYAVGDDG